VEKAVWLTCYFRHLKAVFEEAGVPVTKENKREIDKAIHKIVGVNYKDCSATWKAVKAKLAENREAFVKELKAAYIKFQV
jgi:ribosomal protein L23